MASATMTERRAIPRVPAHVLVMLGASTAGYAAILAGVAGLQSRADAEAIAARAPAVDGVSRISAGHDRLAEALDVARAEYQRTANAYLAAGGSLDALEQAVTALAGRVAEIDGVSRTLPSSVRLPAVRQSVPSARTSTTHATTGASGG
jgi:hypothetical protein